MIIGMDTVRIAIVDDQNLFRQTLSALIKSIDGFEVVTTNENGADFLDYLQKADELPHIILLDMDMMGLNGMDVNLVLRKKYPDIKVIILSIHAQERLISKMMQEGVCSYLLKNCDMDELVTAIKTVNKTGFYINEMILKAIKAVASHKTKLVTNLNAMPVELTLREKEILELICKEYSNPEIAEKLFLSARTVEGHRSNLLIKTGCRNTAGLVLFAVKYGIHNLIF